jgi:hypothetical protein
MTVLIGAKIYSLQAGVTHFIMLMAPPFKHDQLRRFADTIVAKVPVAVIRDQRQVKFCAIQLAALFSPPAGPA